MPKIDFANIVLDKPGTAAALLLTPSWQDLAAPSGPLPADEEVAVALSRQLDGVTDWPTNESLTIVLGAGQHLSPAATVVGDVVVLRVRGGASPSVADVVRTIAPAVLRARLRPAAPDPRCSEPLLALGEALADAGSLALASLPAELRPVHDWFNVKDAAPAVASLAELVLDRGVPWGTREVRLASVKRIDGPSPELANSAAVLVEAFGDAGRARQRPFDLLLAWRKARRRDAFPPLPSLLRKALDEPLAAGMPRDRDSNAEAERAAVADAVLRRIVERGDLPPNRLPAGAPLPLRGLASANARLEGDASVCSWLGEELPPGLRTGCRDEGEGGGWVYVRPVDQGHFEIVSRAISGAEIVLLRWPRWALFPAVNRASRDLLFVDREGVWRTPLEGGSPPRKVWEGSFRHLTARPDAPGWAAVRWPEGDVVVETDAHHGALPVRARGGLAWLDRDILAAVDSATVVLVSSGGDSRALPVDLHCSRSLAAAAGAVVCSFASPCRPSLVRLDLGLGKVQTLLGLESSPFGVRVLSDGTLVFGSGDGLFRWAGSGAAERVGAGLTPGPA